MNEVYSIDIEKIHRDENQPRKNFNKKELEELSYSIEKYGLLQPIIVRVLKENLGKEDVNQEYVIVAGERRYRACILLNLKKINCFIRNKSDNKEIALIENIQRKNLNKIEEAKAINELIKEKNYTQDEVAAILSKSRPYITNILRLLNLDEKTQRALIDEKISDAHARVLAGIGLDRERNILLEKILNEKISVREAERYSREIKKKDVFLDDFLKSAADKIGTKVYVKGSLKKGTICIDYMEEEMLENILNAILQNFD